LLADISQRLADKPTGVAERCRSRFDTSRSLDVLPGTLASGIDPRQPCGIPERVSASGAPIGRTGRSVVTGCQGQQHCHSVTITRSAGCSWRHGDARGLRGHTGASLTAAGTPGDRHQVRITGGHDVPSFNVGGLPDTRDEILIGCQRQRWRPESVRTLNNVSVLWCA
jgi:hypothetical protein